MVCRTLLRPVSSVVGWLASTPALHGLSALCAAQARDRLACAAGPGAVPLS